MNEVSVVEATGIILAGGQSSRMGTNKALLDINGKRVIERVVEELQSTVNNIIIVTNSFEEYEFLGFPLVEDEWKGMGPLAGIHAGLTASQTNKNLIVACDMPFISSSLGMLLLSQLEHYQGVVPEIAGQLHPLFAAYRKEVKEEVKKSLEQDQRRIRSFFSQIHVKIMNERELASNGFEVQEASFFNMNNPNEYAQAVDMEKKVRVKGCENS